MSKKNRKPKFTLDLDFEATVVDDDTTNTILDLNQSEKDNIIDENNKKNDKNDKNDAPTKPSEQEQRDDEMARRRRMRQRQQQLAQQDVVQTVSLEVSSATIQNLNSSNQNNNNQNNNGIFSKNIDNVSISMNMIDNTINKNNNINTNVNSNNNNNNDDSDDGDEDDDDSDSDSDNGIKFISIKKQQRNKIKPISMSNNQDLTTDLTNLAMIADRQVKKAVDEAIEGQNNSSSSNKNNRNKGSSSSASGIELPDDTDHLEDVQIDVAMWRQREAQRLFEALDIAMRHLNLDPMG